MGSNSGSCSLDTFAIRAMFVLRGGRPPKKMISKVLCVSLNGHRQSNALNH